MVNASEPVEPSFGQNLRAPDASLHRGTILPDKLTFNSVILKPRRTKATASRLYAALRFRQEPGSRSHPGPVFALWLDWDARSLSRGDLRWFPFTPTCSISASAKPSAWWNSHVIWVHWSGHAAKADRHCGGIPREKRSGSCRKTNFSRKRSDHLRLAALGGAVWLGKQAVPAGRWPKPKPRPPGRVQPRNVPTRRRIIATPSLRPPYRSGGHPGVRVWSRSESDHSAAGTARPGDLTQSHPGGIIIRSHLFKFPGCPPAHRPPKSPPTCGPRSASCSSASRRAPIGNAPAWRTRPRSSCSCAGLLTATRAPAALSSLRSGAMCSPRCSSRRLTNRMGDAVKRSRLRSCLDGSSLWSTW